MPKKHKFVQITCHAKQCGNYDRLYKNHCRARSGEVPTNWQDCWAFMTEDEAIEVDKQMRETLRARHTDLKPKHYKKEALK